MFSGVSERPEATECFPHLLMMPDVTLRKEEVAILFLGIEWNL